MFHLANPAAKGMTMGNVAIREVSSPVAAKRGSVGDLDWTLNWKVDPGHLYMPMKGYFDESGTHGAGSPALIVAGFLATVEQWDSYERALAALMAEYSVTKFHAKELRQRTGHFKGWPVPKQAQFTSRFLRLADEHLSCGLAAVLPSDSYRQIYRAGEAVRAGRLDSQYGLAVRVALWKALLLMKDRKADWPLNFVFEGGAGHEGDAARIFGEVRDSLLPQYEGVFRSITFDTKEAVPLAIADSLAYAIFRLSAGFSKHPTEPNAAVVGPADPPYYVSKIPMSRTLIDENTLKSLRNNLGGLT
jgi:hypothetical protein